MYLKEFFQQVKIEVLCDAKALCCILVKVYLSSLVGHTVMALPIIGGIVESMK